MKTEIEFLTVEDVINIHSEQVRRYGGRRGIKDRGVLESAVKSPQTMTTGKSPKTDKKNAKQNAPKRHYAYKDIFEMAGVLAHMISVNDCFHKGNMRTGLLAALTFLDMNGITIGMRSDDLPETMLDIVDFKKSMEDLTELFRNLAVG